MKRLLTWLALAALSFPAFSQQVQADYTPKTKLTPGEPHMLFSFPDFISQPDGMALDKAGNVYVSNPSFSAPGYPGLIFKITPKYEWSVFCTLPASDVTKIVGPMGIAFGPDGNLYVADNQYYTNTNYQSRILRVNIQDGEPRGTDVVVKGLKHPNAVRWHRGALYITDTKWEVEDSANTSGVFRIPLAEMQNDSVLIQPTMDESHLITTFEAIRQPNGKAMGTDGMDFDSKGHLFVGMFSDGRVFKLTLNADGTAVESKEEFLKYGTIPSCDGLFIDKRTDNLYIADSEANAIRIVSPSGELSTLAENGDTDGSDGGLDQPCEPLLVGNKLFVANFDKPNEGFVNTRADSIHNMSIIEVPKEFLQMTKPQAGGK